MSRVVRTTPAAIDWTDLGHATRALRVFQDIIRTGLPEGMEGSQGDSEAVE
ncbi:hypothetical protein [Streptomyces sp. NPDC001492]